MRGGKRCSLTVDQRVVVPPKIGSADVASEVKLVKRAMESVGTTLRNHLYLAAGCGVEIGCLPGGADFELFNAFDGCGNDAGRRAASCIAAAIPITRSVCYVRAGHIVAIVAAVERKAVLVRLGASNLTCQRDTYLEHGKCRCIAAEVRQQLKLIVADGRADRRVECLQFRAGGCLDFDHG